MVQPYPITSTQQFCGGMIQWLNLFEIKRDGKFESGVFRSSPLQLIASLSLCYYLISLVDTMAIEAIENQGNEKHHGKCDPVDIIGLSYRFSGMADTPGAFWQMLSKGMTSWSRDARDRFNLESFWHPRSDLPGSVSFHKFFKYHSDVLRSIVQCQ